MAHAYLFCGMRGVGKTTLARLFAKALNCSHRTTDCEPCNECSSCREIAAGESLDVIEIDGASNRGIDDIRSINDSLGYATFQGRYKILIIDEVHMLTKEAFNALLKSLEEPPQNVKFFLATTEAQKVLPTIVSRCQRFDLNRIESGLIVKKLSQIAEESGAKVDEEAFEIIARLSEGSLRDAESLFDQILCFGGAHITAQTILDGLGFISKEMFFDLDQAFAKEELLFAFTLADNLFRTGKDIHFFIELLFEHYRNIAFLLLKKEVVYGTKEERSGYERAQSIYTRREVLHILDYLTKLTLSQSKTSWKKVHLEMALVYIIQSKNRISIEEILRQVQALQAAPSQKIDSPVSEVVKPISEVVKPMSEVVQLVSEPAKAISEMPMPPPEALKGAVGIPSEVRKDTDQARHETLLRFAQVELGGTLKK